jgi:type IV pilus assembly protein PilA
MKSQTKGQKGFSLIELLVVVGIILIIVAIAVPNLMAAKRAAHESSAVGSIRTLHTALISYATQCPQIGFPTDLTGLGPGPGDCTGIAAVDETLGTVTPSRDGYDFTYTPTSSTGTFNDGYTINADPSATGSTGTRHFFGDDTGVIRYNQSSSATTNDNALE